MKFKFILFLFGLICILLPKIGGAQNLRLKPVWGNNAFQLEKKYFLSSKKDSVQINLCKFYISEIELYHQGKLIHKEYKSFHLIKLEDSLSLSFALTNNKAIFDEIRFNLGIDSVTNSSGIYGGDLDPVKGMYWTWQSGYINFKLEGKSSLSKNKTGSFSYHLGGYLEPFLCVQQISLKRSFSNHIEIVFNLEDFVSKLPIENKAEVMSPSLMAVKLSKNLAQSFK